MSILERKVDYLVKIALATNDYERKSAMDKLSMLERMTPEAETKKKKSLQRQISDLLLEIGVPDNLLGYKYITRAVELIYNNDSYANNIYDGLYSAVAAEYNSVASCVERSIRHAIEVAWAQGDMETLTELFGNTVSLNKGKPTNSQFLVRAANIVRQRMEDQEG